MTPRCPLHGQLPPKASPASYYSLLGFIYILMLKLSSCHMYSTAIIAVNGPLLQTGQAFAVSGEGANLREALTRAHQAVSKISFDLPASSSCLAVQQTEPLPSLPAPLSLSLSLFLFLEWSHVCVSCVFQSVLRQSMLFHPVLSPRASCLYQRCLSLHLRFQHAFPSGYWPGGVSLWHTAQVNGQCPWL